LALRQACYLKRAARAHQEVFGDRSESANVFVKAAPSENIAKSCTIWVRGVGFSFGVAEFAATSPPPLTPGCLMISSEVIGPPVIQGLMPAVERR
jgi:hypothetical protein